MAKTSEFEFAGCSQQHVGNHAAQTKGLGNLPPMQAFGWKRRRFAKFNRKESEMNWDRIEGNWKQAAGKVREKWGKLTDDDMAVIDGKQDQLVGRIQERYGIAKDEAERQVNTWIGGQ